MMADMRGDENTPRARISGVWVLILIAAAILVIGDLNRRMADARRLDRDARVLETEVAGLATENASLQTQVAEATSEDLVRKWAHEEGGMVKEGEVLVRPIAAQEATPKVTVTPTSSIPLPSNWEVWWALLFGR
jgi:cell division protein FtsB